MKKLSLLFSVFCIALACSAQMKTSSTNDSNLLPGKFSVSATKQVLFTKANLYWDGTTFHLEADQADYTPYWKTSHVCHFFWTSFKDYKSGNSSYMPYAEKFKYSCESILDKFWCGEDNKLTVDGTDSLYALTYDRGGEWYYLINSRVNADKLYKCGVTVKYGGTSYKNCLIIAPDDFQGTLRSKYTLDELNAAGLVCLPAAGCRDGNDLCFGEEIGYYWSATIDTSKSAYNMNFSSRGIAPLVFNGDIRQLTQLSAINRARGFCLRLVRNL